MVVRGERDTSAHISTGGRASCSAPLPRANDLRENAALSPSGSLHSTRLAYGDTARVLHLVFRRGSTSLKTGSCRLGSGLELTWDTAGKGLDRRRCTWTTISKQMARRARCIASSLSMSVKFFFRRRSSSFRTIRPMHRQGSGGACFQASRGGAQASPRFTPSGHAACGPRCAKNARRAGQH